MTIRFNQRVKHPRAGHIGVIDFHPGVAYAFDDPDAEPYFRACGWGEPTDDEPAVTISIDEIDIDPDTVFGSGPQRGERVLGGS